MDLKGKKVIALGERDSVPGEVIRAVAEAAGADVIETRTECFVWTASGAMDPENQGLIKRLAEEFGTEDLVVILGAADAEAVEVAVETVRDGDPAYVGPLAGVQLGLPVLHIFEDEVKDQVDPGVYDAHVGFFALSFDVDEIKAAMKRARGEA